MNEFEKGDCFPNVSFYRMNDGSPKNKFCLTYLIKKNNISWRSWCLYTDMYK